MICSCRQHRLPDISRLFLVFPTRWRKSTVVCLAVLLLILVSYWLDLWQKPIYGRPCPLTLAESIYESIETKSTLTPDNLPIDCAALLIANNTEVNRAKQFEWCYNRNAITPDALLELVKDCQHFHDVTNMFTHHVIEDEKNFPIAFSVLVYKNIEQVVRLIHTIYRPHNVYCIHIDQKAATTYKDALVGMTRCFENMFVASEFVDVRWAEYSVLEAEIVCLRDLWKYKKWKYFINLTGMEFPIRTNWELVQILKSYKGANDIDGTPHKRPLIWTNYVWRREFWRTWREKSPPPANVLLTKGSAHVAATRDFIGYALFNKTGRDLLKWMEDIRVPDEHYFSTLNHNPHLGIPGAYKGDPDLKLFYNRFKVWQTPEETCSGHWIRQICNLGVGDLYRIPVAKELFLNKFSLDIDPLAYRCAEEWYKKRTMKNPNPDFNISYYANLPFVNNHN